jgi:acyl carrier protein
VATEDPRDPFFAEVRAIVDRVAARRVPADVGPDTRLSEDYWLDSVEMLEVVIACETTLGVAFDERSDFESGSLRTLGTLTELLRSKLAARKDSA